LRDAPFGALVCAVLLMVHDLVLVITPWDINPMTTQLPEASNGQSEAVSICNPHLCDSGGSGRSVGGAEPDDLIAFGARAGTIFHQ
jgi:hypothetical protein